VTELRSTPEHPARRTAWMAWVGIFVLYLAHSLGPIRVAFAERMTPDPTEALRLAVALLILLATRPRARPWVWIFGLLSAIALLISGSEPKLDGTVIVLYALAFEHRWIPPRRAAPPGQAIVFFDGVCGLCNRFVDLLLRADRESRLRFAPLQGLTASERLRGHDPQAEPTTVILIEGERESERSEAAIHALAYLGGLWRLSEVFLLVPRGLRDALYDFIARHRYSWFGKRETCRIPTAAERARFLD
jgi:predicted DCC family thiol-disulfide oxidoreductase YuxK